MRLNDIARVLLAGDIDGNGQVDHRDLGAFDHRDEAHRAALGFMYDALREPADNGASLLDAYLAGDDALVAETMDALFGGRWRHDRGCRVVNRGIDRLES